KYDTEYVDSNNWLNGCVPDANHVHSLITTRGEWDAANVTKLTDSAAKHDAIRAAIASAASKAVAGDTFLYFHSSHGGNYTYTFVTNTALYTDWPIMVYDVDPEGIDNCICSYDADYPAAELAADLAAFDPAVNIVVMIDACHSAGMFQYTGTPVSQRIVRRNAAGKAMRSADASVFAEAVGAQIGAIRRARGIRAAANVAFVTAANFDEYSYDAQSGDGGEFTTAFIEGVTNGLCDGADYGDQDGWATFYEGWNYAKDIATGMPEGTEVDYDGHAVDANGYALYDNSAYTGAPYYEPAYYYDYYFTHPQIDNESLLRVVRVGYAGNPTLAAPVANPAENVTASSFTASWSAVDGATGYHLQVATDSSFSTGAASDTLTSSDFAATSTTYTGFSGVEKPSGAVYAGKTAKDSSGAIQLNATTTTGAGIWTTASGGNVSRVAVVWNSGTTTSKPRSLLIYGSDSPLTSYDAVKAATSLGSIVYGSTSSLDIEGAYAYVGILANGGALYLDSIGIDWGVPGSASSIVVDQNVGNVTSYQVTGLEPETDYWYRVQALSDPVDSDFSNVIALTTEAGTPYAPVWSEIPEQAGAVGVEFSLDLAPYVSGSPKPALSASVGTIDGTVFSYTPAAPGTVAVTLTAANDIDTAETSFALVVADAPITVPVLTLSNATDSTFDADWTACTGAASYQFQVATDDQFTSGGGAGGSGDFTLVTSVAGLTAGEYVILADGTDTAMNSTYSGTSSKYLSCTDVTVSGNTVSTEDASIIWTLAGDASSCTLFNGDAGKYVNPAASKTVGWADTASGSWTLSVTEDGIVTAANADDTSWVLQYNSGSPRFMCYSSSQKKLRFFRRGASKSAAKDDGSLLLDTTTNGISLTVTGLEPDTTYYARVRMAEGEWSAVESITTTGEGPAGPAKYAVCVGLSEYDMAAFAEMGLEVTPLKGCVNDATYLKKNLTERGGWDEGNVSLLTNGSAT
ncbi:MAG: caspase family protein, partial [Kiritimatiellae bacterium]|nr:caspase family protein [Kiritimatiellia bacterium]